MTAFDLSLTGSVPWLELASGERIELPVHRWRRAPDTEDAVLLGRCAGPTIDLGCGPGRFVAALTERGIPALGVDSSPIAIGLARARGAPVLHRDVFTALPRTGNWRHVLLADGNIGIGGDPERLLHRAARLLERGGSVLLELGPPGHGLRRERARIASRDWFHWAFLGADAVGPLADRAGLHRIWSARAGQRWFTELRKP
ncbi:class I SAM-dependent methyltransferase [Sciscionella marina]|uniref:methyltransferase domain-containing protein n=1 Tax=Sciscionella marina TaxID=508770 RepID=UPI000371E400|nr:class I SAM-dependent methyltransferase [Sciscionella marina]